MKIIITGGSGYIGAQLSQYLAIVGEQVIPVCFPSVPGNDSWKSKMFAIIEGDLQLDQTIAEIVETKPDVIIHLVSLDHHDSEKAPDIVNNINVMPTWRLLDACTKNGLKKFIYFSTVQVYGHLPNAIIDEKQPTNTTNTYALTHLISEEIGDHYNRKTATNVISIRLSNSYGYPVFKENNCWWLAINDLCKNAFANSEIRLRSDGTPQRDFIHGNDFCEAIRILLNAEKSTTDNKYHISSGITLTLLELAKIIQTEFHSRYNKILPIIAAKSIIDDTERIISSEKYTVNNNRLKSLGFIPKYTIEKGINELFSYLENNQESSHN